MPRKSVYRAALRYSPFQTKIATYNASAAIQRTQFSSTRLASSWFAVMLSTDAAASQ